MYREHLILSTLRIVQSGTYGRLEVVLDFCHIRRLFQLNWRSFAALSLPISRVSICSLTMQEEVGSDGGTSRTRSFVVRFVAPTGCTNCWQVLRHEQYCSIRSLA